MGDNKELLFSDLRSNFLLIVWMKTFLLFLLSLLAYNFATKERKIYEVCFRKTHPLYLPLLPTLPPLNHGIQNVFVYLKFDFFLR